MAKQEFLKAVEQADHAAFLTILQHYVSEKRGQVKGPVGDEEKDLMTLTRSLLSLIKGSKRSTVDLQEVLAELNRKQKEQIWVSLYSWTDVQLLKLVEDNVPEGDVVEPDQPPDEERKGPPQKDGSVSQSCQDPPQIEGSASQSHQYLPIKFLVLPFQVANGLVRMNATALLCDAFPLMDSYLNQEERGNLLEKQYQTIITLLIDPCHLVRITAIKGVSSILASFWLTIPSDIIKTIFQKLLSDLVYDASSAEVRTQVIKGLTLLVDSRDAAPFLIEVLPRIADVFDDISANVRIAFVKLLLKVKSSKVIRYWDIIPVPHLLHRMEEDKPVVCKLLTQLLLSSFHPVHQEDEEILQRCLSLLEENRAAARRFYRYASNKLDINSTVHFMLLIWRCVTNYVLAQQSQDASYNEENDISDSTSSEEGQPVPDDQGHLKRAVPRRGVHRAGHSGSAVMVADKENTGGGAVSSSDGGEAVDEDDGGDGSPLDNPDIIIGLLDTVVILWTSNAHKLVLSQNLKYLEALRTRLSRSMPLLQVL
ncbi:condensin-2 complex subunit G2-like [Homarus americanus]|uniref:condensin-2 complex subunit G2-like n=1 Tax=Homarus americanus TaxID=6706 RepID=UPI001C47B6BC|nr:condensin-2 complex subunit G2-like [Homarus americanus]